MRTRGRKRKIGDRHPSGGLIRKQPDDRTRISRQPHRRILPSDLRLSEQAESLLGRLFLIGKLRRTRETDDDQAELRYYAGHLYAAITGAYRASILAPSGLGGRSKGYACYPDDCMTDANQCECLRRSRAYNGAFEALFRSGQRAAKAVAMVAIQDRLPAQEDYLWMLDGLDALSAHFGLTERKQIRYLQNAHSKSVTDMSLA